MTVIAVMPTTVIISIKSFCKFLDLGYADTGVSDELRIGIYNNTELKDGKFIKKFVKKAFAKKNTELNEMLEACGGGLDISTLCFWEGQVLVNIKAILKGIDGDWDASHEEYLAVLLDEIGKVIKKAAVDKNILADAEENLLEIAGA